MSIAGKLVFILYFSGLLLVAVFGAFAWVTMEQTVDRTTSRQLESVRGHLAVSLPRPVYEMDTEAVIDTLTAQFIANSLEAIVVYSDNKKPMSGLMRKRLLTEPTDNETEASRLISISELPVSDHLVTGHFPIIFKDKTYGEMAIAINRQVIARRKSSILMIELMQCALMLLLLTTVIAYVSRRFLVKPLQAIHQAMQTTEAAVTQLDKTQSVAEWHNLEKILPASRLKGAFKELKDMRQQLVNMVRAIEQNQSQLQLSEEYLRITMRSIGDAVITTDCAGLVKELNTIAESLTGWSREEAIGQPLAIVFKIINSESREKVESPVEKVLKSGEIVGLANHTALIARNGQEHQIADSGAPIRNDAGEIVGVVLVFRDISEQYMLESQLKHSQKMDAIGQLAGGVAHDFNNMLGGIIGAVDVLREDLEQKNRRLADAGSTETFTSELDMLDIIETAGERASQLTQQLLAFSRKSKPLSTTLCLHHIVKDAKGILERTLDRQIHIHASLDAENDRVMGDPTSLQNAFLNICVNARDAMPGGGDLYIDSKQLMISASEADAMDLEDEGEYIVVTFRDTGSGMSTDTRKKAFEPFFTTKPQGKGTGLGLSAVYGIVKDHHGAIELESIEGEGTTFSIYLPLVTETEIVVPKPSHEPIRGEGKILLIDDELLVRTMARQLMPSLGYEVIMADGGYEGLDVYEQRHEEIDIVLLDMIMPDMNGETCFKELKKLDPFVKVILTSGFVGDAKVSGLMEQGVLAFLRKPYRRHELARVLAEML